MKYQSVKGMEDILPQNARPWQELERIARIELESSGYKEIRTPVLEETAVFARSIGEETDIVKKEMFTFSDRKERSLTLRPEGTAPIVRAYIEHSLNKISSISQLYYIGPMFRSERPQKGRLRQFHQIGVEIIGSNSPRVDGEVIRRLNSLLKKIGLKDFTIKINSLGCSKDKLNFAVKLKDYLKGEKAHLCDDCRTRMEKNVLRVLDCKNENCGNVIKNAPDVVDSLCSGCVDHFAAVSEILKSEKIDFKRTKNLVRGLDYYTGTVFEVTHPDLGGQDALAAGGRYDNLVKEMDGPDAGACGFAIGMERTLLVLGDKLREKPAVLYIATLGKNGKAEGLRLAENIKEELNKDRFGICVFMDIEESSLKSQMRAADGAGAKFVLIIGDDEIAKGEAVLRDMNTKEQINIKFSDTVNIIKEKIG